MISTLNDKLSLKVNWYKTSLANATLAGDSAGFSGAHYCIGAPLARVQAIAAFTALVERCPAIALARGEIRHDPRRMDRYERVMVTTRR